MWNPNNPPHFLKACFLALVVTVTNPRDPHLCSVFCLRFSLPSFKRIYASTNWSCHQLWIYTDSLCAQPPVIFWNQGVWVVVYVSRTGFSSPLAHSVNQKPPESSFLGDPCCVFFLSQPTSFSSSPPIEYFASAEHCVESAVEPVVKHFIKAGELFPYTL